MSSRIFQSVISQMKDCTKLPLGVVDAEGTVVACTEPALVGQHWPQVADAINRHEGMYVAVDGKLFRPLAGRSNLYDFAAFVVGEGDVAQSYCALAVVALNGAKSFYEEKHDRASFVKNIITDNIMLGDVYLRARELHFPPEAVWGVFLARPTEESNPAVLDAIQALFPDRQNDFVLSITETDIAIVKMLEPGADTKTLYALATEMLEHVEEEFHVKCVIGIGTLATHLRDLARAYKEAGVAIEVGKVFNTEMSIINYENLGIGRLIYQLPTTLCEMFLQEVFKKNPIDSLDQETLFTINKFFENNLNVSETARKLFVHRNTLVYRLEKIKKLNGLDLREFDDAITFKVALMVKKYLVSRGIDG